MEGSACEWHVPYTPPVNYPFGIYSPLIGAVTETFIKRHARDLLPGGTVVLGELQEEGADWTIEGPTLTISPRDLGSRAGSVRRASRLVSIMTMGRLHPVRRFLRRHGTEVLLGEYLDASLPLLPIARDLGIRFFVHAHGYDASQLLQLASWREKFLAYNSASGIITMSHASRRRLTDIGLRPEAISVIPYGVDVPSDPVQRARSRNVRCLAVGRMVEKKAPILMLDSFRRAATAFPELRLDYVGTGMLLPAVRQYLQASGLQGAVRLHGALPNHDVLDLMKSADIFVQHSITAIETEDEEGLPVAILEAMAHALPVIATRHAGIPEAVLEGSTGYLVEEGDTNGMAERILALARDPALRRQMGRSGWERAREVFSWERERAQLLNLMGLEAAATP